MTIRRHHATRRSRWNPFSVMRLKTQAFRGPFEHKKQFGPRGEKMYICVTCVLVWEATLLFLVTALSSSPRVASFPHYSQAVCRMSIPLELMSISNNNNLLDPHSIKPVPKNIPPLPTTVTAIPSSPSSSFSSFCRTVVNEVNLMRVGPHTTRAYAGSSESSDQRREPMDVNSRHAHNES